jgi:hypothetical protein
LGQALRLSPAAYRNVVWRRGCPNRSASWYAIGRDEAALKELRFFPPASTNPEYLICRGIPWGEELNTTSKAHLVETRRWRSALCSYEPMAGAIG